jgi:serine/threonine-protein kinase
MATVYLAQDLKHDRAVALKVLHPEIAAGLGTERFLREIRLTARLQHPHILPVFDSGAFAGQPWYTMPYVRGESLRDRLRREIQLPVETAVEITRQVAFALDYAHREGAAHRDIKPENVLLSEGHALVADFGVAKAIGAAGDEPLTGTGLAIGTAAYMAPEQASSGQIDGRTDVYALGCVLYEMLAGEPPFTGPTPQAIVAKRFAHPAPSTLIVRPNVPRTVDEAVRKAMATVPADRYQTISQFAQALENATPTRTANSSARRPRSRPIWWTSAAALAVVTVSVGWWGASRARTGAASRAGVALLPCENRSPRQEEEHIGDRWSEELIQKLVRVGGLNPKAWVSVRRYRDTRLALRQIGVDLNAGTLVRCQVAEQATGVRLSVELIRAHDERVIWSNDYERPVGAVGINAAQSAAARDIAQELGAGLPARAVAAVERPLTPDTVALRLYRLGKHFLETFEDPSSVRKSIDYFERAIASDSNFATAYVGLAEALIWRTERENRVSRDYYPAAAQLLRRAIALDPTIAEAHTFLARYLLDYTHDWAGAEDEHQRALALNPSSVDVHAWYGWYLQTASRFKEAIAEFDRAVELDPTNPLARAQLIRALEFGGNEARALRELREALELWPEWEALYHHWAVMLLRRGQRDSALAVLDRHVHTPTWYNGWLYAAAGRRDKGQEMLDSLLALNESRPVDPGHVAALEIGLGNTEEALNWLERAYAERSQLLLFLLGPHPAFEGLRGDPRFQELRRKAGFKK